MIGMKLWKAPMMAKILPTSSGATYLLIMHLIMENEVASRNAMHAPKYLSLIHI